MGNACVGHSLVGAAACEAGMGPAPALWEPTSQKRKKKRQQIYCVFLSILSLFFLQYLINPQHCLNLENSEMTPDLALPRASPPPRVQRVYTRSCGPVSRVPQWLPR